MYGGLENESLAQSLTRLQSMLLSGLCSYLEILTGKDVFLNSIRLLAEFISSVSSRPPGECVFIWGGQGTSLSFKDFQMIKSGRPRIILSINSKINQFGTLIISAKFLHLYHFLLGRSKSQVPPTLF